MTEYSTVGAGTRIFILVLLVIVLALGGLVWFDYLGLIDARERLTPALQAFGIGRRPAAAAGPLVQGDGLIQGEDLIRSDNPEDPFLLDKERLGKQAEALGLRLQELDKRETDLQSREVEVAQMLEQLQEREKALEEREKVFNERIKAFENRRVNLRQNAEYLVGMPPAKAVDILLEMDDIEIIDLFRIAEEQAQTAGELSLVAYWISLMPPERAAALQRKMTR